MLKEYKKSFENLCRLFESIILVLSFFGATILSPGRKIFPLSDLHLIHIAFLVWFITVWFYTADRFNLYSSKRLSGFSREFRDLIKATLFSVFLAFLPLFLFTQKISEHFLFLYALNVWMFHTALIVLYRFILRRLLRFIRASGYNYRQVIIVGRNDRAIGLLKAIKTSPHFGLRILGFVDEDRTDGLPADLMNYPLLGNLEDLKNILRENVVDELFITLPVKSFYTKINEVLSLCEKVGIEVEIVADLFRKELAKWETSKFDDLHLINFYTTPRTNWQLRAKRVLDLVLSAVLLVSLSPLFAIVSLSIKLTSKGPIFFKQKRVGHNGRLFTMMKFRTMVPDADRMKQNLLSMNEMDGPVFKIKNDPRVTSVGVFLRRTSIDELPQLFNVLLGHMSLVGPRPPLPGEVDEYDLVDRRRLSVKPGVTCIWQVCGRNNVSFEQWMDLDRQYIDHWSIWLDFKILAKTIPAVLSQRGAH